MVPAPHPASLPTDELITQCDLTRDRGSGPGGQHRNKVETRVVIVHTSTGVEAQAGERRSQAQNRSEAIFRLRLALATRVRAPVPLGEARTALWRSRTSGGRILCNPEHNDYPEMLALAMDVLHAAGWDPRKAAARLCCSMSQVLKLVKDHPAAWTSFNMERVAGKKKLLQ